MATHVGQCEQCGQRFKRSRVAGRTKGYRIVDGDGRDTRIQCERCGQKGRISRRPT